MKQIVCLATSPWYPIPTRKQQVMSRMPDAEILYFDPSATIIAPLRDKSTKPLMTAWKEPGEKVRDNITVYRLPPVLPFFYKCRAINRINQKRIARFVCEKMKEHGFSKPLLWVYSPVTVDCVDLIAHEALVYDCVDRHSAYGGLMNPALVDAMELELAAKTDMTFATAASLAERLKSTQPEAEFIPNGANFERFFEASKPQLVPEENAMKMAMQKINSGTNRISPAFRLTAWRTKSPMPSASVMPFSVQASTRIRIAGIISLPPSGTEFMKSLNPMTRRGR